MISMTVRPGKFGIFSHYMVLIPLIPKSKESTGHVSSIGMS